MGPARTRSIPFVSLLLLLSLLRRLLSLLPAAIAHRRRLLSLVALRDLQLCFSLLLSGLGPASLHLPNLDSTLRFWLPRSKSATKPPLLLIHGFGGNARWQFEKNVPRLARSFDLYIPDLLFFGGSSTAATGRSVELQARCLIEAMGMLGVERYSVAGISYGGFVAYRVAELAGEAAVERVVVMTAGICAGEGERREMAEREGRDVAELLLPTTPEDLMGLMRRSMYRPPRWMPEFLLRDFIEVMYKVQRKERVELLKELIANGAGVDPLPILKQETLILWGDKDTVFPISLAYKLQRHLGEKARLEVVKDAGHALPLEKPDIVNRLIEWFLLEPSAATSS